MDGGFLRDRGGVPRVCGLGPIRRKCCRPDRLRRRRAPARPQGQPSHRRVSYPHRERHGLLCGYSSGHSAKQASLRQFPARHLHFRSPVWWRCRLRFLPREDRKTHPGSRHCLPVPGARVLVCPQHRDKRIFQPAGPLATHAAEACLLRAREDSQSWGH